MEIHLGHTVFKPHGPNQLVAQGVQVDNGDQWRVIAEHRPMHGDVQLYITPLKQTEAAAAKVQQIDRVVLQGLNLGTPVAQTPAAQPTLTGSVPPNIAMQFVGQMTPAPAVDEPVPYDPVNQAVNQGAQSLQPQVQRPVLTFPNAAANETPMEPETPAPVDKVDAQLRSFLEVRRKQVGGKGRVSMLRRRAKTLQTEMENIAAELAEIEGQESEDQQSVFESARSLVEALRDELGEL